MSSLRSPREKMAGWVHLPRLVDKVRLHLAGKLPSDYQPNFGRGFDGRWLEMAGIKLDDFILMVSKRSDGEIEKWVRENVQKSQVEMEQFNQALLNRGRDPETAERLRKRKEEAGWGSRHEIQTFVDLIDAEEGRL